MEQRYTYAWTAVITGDGYGIGKADKDIPGYSPVVGFSFGSWGAAVDHADELNRAMGISDDEAAQIVISTMRRRGRNQVAL